MIDELMKDPREIQRDACGVGFVANIQGIATHKVVADGLSILEKLDHRGGAGRDALTSDGVGLMTELPHQFWVELGILPAASLQPGKYAAGQLFLPNCVVETQECKVAIEQELGRSNLSILCWREVPVQPSFLGPLAKSNEPSIWQLFVECPKEMEIDTFEWALYVVRKKIEAILKEKSEFYFCSFSARTIVYKGLLLANSLAKYYPDLDHPHFCSRFSMVHQRFSTNTHPTWPLAQPFRTLCHNGEINTIRGNINGMHAREKMMATEQIGPSVDGIGKICSPQASDSAVLDNVAEFLLRNGREFPEVLTMLIPEPFEGREDMPRDLRDYYEFQRCLMEPWDGPAFVGFSNGELIGAVLDRNGLRPGRYWVTVDGMVVMASEAGVLPIDPEKIVFKGRLSPGRIFVVDMKQGKIIADEQIKKSLASRRPYGRWLRDNLRKFEDLPSLLPPSYQPLALEDLERQFLVHGFTREDFDVIVNPMAIAGKEPTGSMGNDTPLAVLSQQPLTLFNYFKQLFAQVTNPPIDAIREELVTSLTMNLGCEGSLLEPQANSCRMLQVRHPILSNQAFDSISKMTETGLTSSRISILFSCNQTMMQGIEKLKRAASEAVENGANILVLSDRNSSKELIPIPALLAVSAIHFHLIHQGQRPKCSLILESGEPREVHHFALLFGYGVAAINPYLVMDYIAQFQKSIANENVSELQQNYCRAVEAGLLKVMSKMGISTLQSYRGAQVFEAIGLKQDFVDQFFPRTTTRIQGIGLSEIESDTRKRHNNAFAPKASNIPLGGHYAWRKDGEKHLHDPQMIAGLQQSTKLNSREEFVEYCRKVDEYSAKNVTLRSLLGIKWSENPLPLEEVEPVTSILKRFSTGAMSFGSISKEAHETIAVAMNRIGGKSNSGEGGEDAERYQQEPNGDSKRSAVKQIASGRFGVSSHYLANADELQIKMAQGAKPGEGGQLPGDKVDSAIAAVRNSTPGVTLISPPPHHDIYSIEDLAQLIYDLKNSNPSARINVKLVSAVGVGTIAAGVAKAKSDVILISGYEGGTGASPLTSVKHSGLPWELGLSEAHKQLVKNDLRGRVVLQTDGQLRTPRDFAIATLLGAEEWSVGTGALVILGCVMMRKCHLNTCPVGIATQDPELRKRFRGQPEHLINFFTLIAEEMRLILARLGFRNIEEMVGRSDLLFQEEKGPIANGVDLSSIIAPEPSQGNPTHYNEPQVHGLEQTLDQRVLIPQALHAWQNRKSLKLVCDIKNTDRSVGTSLSYEISKSFGANGLSKNSIRLNFVGSAGQSFMAFGAAGITAKVQGEVNDFCGKGLSGARIIVVPSENSSLVPELNTIGGNVCLYGATSGSLFMRGIAGERFAVRNSGANAVVEGVGDHGCEYMTGGRVVVLGKTGRNFAAGMSGGISYVYDIDGEFDTRVNSELVSLRPLSETEDGVLVYNLVNSHYKLTKSSRAQTIIEDWEKERTRFIRIIPRAYAHAIGDLSEVSADNESHVVTRYTESEQGGIGG